jgi:hypothetical protein
VAVRSGAYDAARVLAEHNLPGLVVTDTAGKTVGDILPTKPRTIPSPRGCGPRATRT